MPDSIIKLDLEAEGAEPPQGEANQTGTWIFHIVFFGSLLTGLFYEYPNVWLTSIQLALPWIAVGLVLCFPKRYRLFPEFALPVGAQELRPYLFGAFFISLCTGGALEPMSIPSDLSIVLTLLLAAALGGVTVFSERRAGGAPVCAILAAPLFLLYGYAAVYGVNCAMDSSPAVVRRMAVSRKIHERHGGSVVLEPSRVEPQSGTVVPKHYGVYKRVFDSLQEGDLACVAERNGLLGLRWSIVQVCGGR